jgi:Ca2+/H+ antiporter
LQVSSKWQLSRSFLGFIVLPIAGNACEHITGNRALPSFSHAMRTC